MPLLATCGISDYGTTGSHTHLTLQYSFFLLGCDVRFQEQVLLMNIFSLFIFSLCCHILLGLPPPLHLRKLTLNPPDLILELLCHRQ